MAEATAHTQSNLLLRFWGWFFGSSREAGRGRRWALVFLLALGLVFGFLQAPADSNRIVNYFFSARTLGHFVVISLGFWLALRSAAAIQVAIYNLESLSEAQSHILAAALHTSGKKLQIRNGEAVFKSGGLHLAKVGGPGKVQVTMENAAVFESPAGQVRVIGPGQDPKPLGSFERLQGVIDLRDQVLKLNLWGRTRDGIQVQIEGTRLVFSIARSKREPSLSEPHPFLEQAARRLVYEQRVERSLLSPARQSSQSQLGERGAAFFERQLQAFIGELTLGELLATPANDQTLEQSKSNALFLAREAIRHQFSARVEKLAFEFGLQLHWIDIGTWKVDDLAQGILDDYIEEHGVETQAISTNPYQDSRGKELSRLFEQLSKIDTQELFTLERSAALAKVLSAFYGLFDGLKLSYGEQLGEDGQQLDSVLHFLKSLGRRLERQSK
ncbi:MAG: hypothetical protein O3B43_05095 [Chloroflexi bacterium]|nr:hypothetical protein [Chloroflexota bacterium]